ncbi:MAG: ABC transporter permease [Lachnospiraceae bacterium]|nr:ABC transporter permease [Lachnospiraceae bacterium]
MSRLKNNKSLMQALSWIGMIIIAFIIFGIFLLMQGANPLEAYKNMFESTLTNQIGISKLILKSVPFILLAVATSISTRAGLVNVGVEGQLMIGMLFTITAANFLFTSLPTVLGLILLAIVGMLGGALYGGVAGLFRVKANMNETITTVVMNYISYFIVSLAVYGYLRDPEGFNWPMSTQISDSLTLPKLFGTVNIGIIIALLVVALVWYFINKTKTGFKMKVVCGNPNAAKNAGINVNKVRFFAMVATGAIAGLAGMIEICGVEGRLRTTTCQDYGYLGFLAAWMAWNNPVLSVATAVIISFLSVSGNVLEFKNNLPASSTQILMSIVLLAIMWRGKGRKES